MSKTLEQFDSVIKDCKSVFVKKTKDYGTAWRILRPSSLTDQIFIKAQRIRTIEEKGEQKVDEGRKPEFVGIVNYGIMALVQLTAEESLGMELSEAKAEQLYDSTLATIRELLVQKNHDYGDAWRSMRVESYSDLILMKLLRIKQIEDNEGSTLISEGIDAGYQDIINYAAFALIKLGEQE